MLIVQPLLQVPWPGSGGNEKFFFENESVSGNMSFLEAFLVKLWGTNFWLNISAEGAKTPAKGFFISGVVLCFSGVHGF